MTDAKTLSTIKKQEDGTIELSITLPSVLITKTWEEVVEQMVQSATFPGFRTGKAPRKMVEEKLDKERIREEVLKKVLPEAYISAVKEHKINPIINPKIHVEKLDEGKDWQFSAITCEVPNVALNGYKDAIKKITSKSKIIIPGKEQPAPSLDEIIKTMIEHVTITVPAILTEGEVERLLSQLLGEIKSLGLSLDQYLASTQRTVEQLREEYKKKAENDIKFEFALQKIAEEEKITVDQKEIDEALAKAKDEKERKQLEGNIYLLANILRQQKTLDFLKNL